MRRKISIKLLSSVFAMTALTVAICLFATQKQPTIEPTVSFTNVKENNKKTSQSSAKMLEKTAKEELSQNIEEVLVSEDYKDLPIEAKNLIRKNYEETKTIILTEKNKKAGQPYLNPKYVEYLDGNLNSGAIIPEPFIIDYDAANKVSSGGNLPSKYDLRNVNGKKYITGLKNQNELGICWSFASVEQAESYLMIHDEDYYENPTLFSTRQMDYATAVNTFDDFENLEAIKAYGEDDEFEQRVLGDGGNYFYSSTIMTHGLSLVSETEKEPWNSLTWTKDELTLYPKLDKSEILNYGNSLYEVDSTVDFPMLNLAELDLNNATDQQTRTDFLNVLKTAIMENGGLYVGTQAPAYSCSALNLDSGEYNGTFIIRNDGHCVDDSGHAMQVIGWDDNYSYTYKYCAGSGEYSGQQVHNYNGNICKNSGQTVSGTGAWLLRNSWGNQARTDYIWLAYDSSGDDFAFADDIKKTSDRTWDNIYYDTMDNYIGYVAVSDTIDFSAPEKLQKVKYKTATKDGTYVVLIYDGDPINDANAELVTYDIMETNYPGYYTFDFSNKNITLDGKKTIAVGDYGCFFTGSCTSILYSNSVSVFTENVDKTQSITTENNSIAIAESSMVQPNEYYGFRIYSTTKNIPANSEISYQLYNSKNEDVSEEYFASLKYNVVATNDVYPEIIISGTLPMDVYYLKISYGKIESGVEILVGYDHVPEPLEISSSNENYDATEKIIDKIPYGTTLDELLSEFTFNSDYHAESDDVYAATGAVIRIVDYMGRVVDEITLVVRGDVSGDGDIDPLDYVKIRKYIMSQTTLEGIYNRAADYNDDGEIDVLDYVKIRKLIMLN
ncbi:MAG: dockerin type I domain-containing protein [Candidatus Saccharibacteria bacterium]|nr:dockerin type I domain-containing protein [Candidatus Saccharibacteria bacterium]